MFMWVLIECGAAAGIDDIRPKRELLRGVIWVEQTSSKDSLKSRFIVRLILFSRQILGEIQC
jgi:hypothetical protein